MHGEAGDVAGEMPQRLADRGYGERRQAGGKVGGLDAGFVRWRDLAQGAGRPSGKQVADKLRRGGVGAAAGLESAALPFPLEGDAGQRAVGVIGRGDADDDARVGVELGAGILAHAVGGDAAGFGRCGHDPPAGAHAEAVDRAAVAGVVDQFVVGGPQHGWPAKAPKRARSISDWGCSMRAPMENGLASIMDAAPVQHGEGVAGAVADGQDDVVGVDLLAAGQRQAADVAVGVQLDVLDARAEAVFAAQGLDLGADALDDGDQAEGADMGFAGGKDFFRRAGFDEFGQQFARRGGAGP